MIPVKIDGANEVLIEGDGKLPRLYCRRENRFSFSRWEPTLAEMTIISMGGFVEIATLGEHPPMVVRVVPFVEHDFDDDATKAL